MTSAGSVPGIRLGAGMAIAAILVTACGASAGQRRYLPRRLTRGGALARVVAGDRRGADGTTARGVRGLDGAAAAAIRLMVPDQETADGIRPSSTS